MSRTYLEEDMHLIQRYFPGARGIALQTPFDLTDKPAKLRLHADTFPAREGSMAHCNIVEDAIWIS
jgi:hypothetical protein